MIRSATVGLERPRSSQSYSNGGETAEIVQLGSMAS
jgi:hypothetical protein